MKKIAARTKSIFLQQRQNLIYDFLYRIKATGLSIDIVYDIGACKGKWSRDIKKKALPNSDFYLFEANPAYKKTLNSSGFKFFNQVLSNPGRDYVEFYDGTDTGDSYYKENTAWYDLQKSVRLPCETLDAIVQKNNLPHPNFIKIDTQGSELDILAGAETVLSHTDLIYIECPIINYNSGAPTINDYLNYFRRKEFIPVDIFEIHRLEETLIQIDIMFMSHKAKTNTLGENVNIRPFA